MFWRELSETLLDYIEGVTVASTPQACITELSMEVPLELGAEVKEEKPVLFGVPPHTRWKSGMLPAVHRARLLVRLEGEQDGAS